MAYVKKHETVLAVCDEELIGKKFHEGKLCLKVSKRFYKGEKVNDDELKKILKDATNVNMVGSKSVKVAVDLGLVNKKEVIYVEGVAHAQFIVL